MVLNWEMRCSRVIYNKTFNSWMKMTLMWMNWITLHSHQLEKAKGMVEQQIRKEREEQEAKDEDEVEELPEINQHLMTKVTKLNEHGVL